MKIAQNLDQLRVEHDPIIHDNNLYLSNELIFNSNLIEKLTAQVYRPDSMNVEYIVCNEKHEMPDHIRNLLVIDNQQPDVM